MREQEPDPTPLHAHIGGCSLCHIVNEEWPLATSKFELCATPDCHAALKDAPEQQHGPFGIHDCTICHRPHTSEHEHLLVRPHPDLCTYCHDKLMTCPAASPSFAPADPACTVCHGAHGGERPFLLRPEVRQKYFPAGTGTGEEKEASG
jgi:predicted CXXCH cytochrome family protein